MAIIYAIAMPPLPLIPFMSFVNTTGTIFKRIPTHQRQFVQDTLKQPRGTNLCRYNIIQNDLHICTYLLTPGISTTQLVADNALLNDTHIIIENNYLFKKAIYEWKVSANYPYTTNIPEELRHITAATCHPGLNNIMKSAIT